MSARRNAGVAVVWAILAVVLWWLSKGSIRVLPPATDPPVEGYLEQSVTTTWMLLAATVAAGMSLLFTTLAILRGAGLKAR
ncbi:hypothetical protein NCCP2495_14080 [Dietzia sp. NCCP-2495]|uniref:hypothetical protein n=1 Tax=Dietzia sp. NCCP-2495 TaxID=2934675 RepID=UPI00222FFEC2|nr:hypothetical protein [Dietzia sp. NCCP-2495]GLB63529.1 hypothetical protein NCCP2495_14080 [Dietzia sp. NCCP-2495]